MFSAGEIREANERAAQHLAEQPHIVKARYDVKLGRIILDLSTHAWFAFRPTNTPGLNQAAQSALKKIEVTPSRLGVYVPLLDEYFDLETLYGTELGTRRHMAARLGAAGGSVRSKAKTAAARSNGKLGGRPRKSAAG